MSNPCDKYTCLDQSKVDFFERSEKKIYTTKAITLIQLHIAIFKLGKQEIVIFYTEILTRKVVLWCFFTNETSEKIHNSTFLVKISV